MNFNITKTLRYPINTNGDEHRDKIYSSKKKEFYNSDNVKRSNYEDIRKRRVYISRKNTSIHDEKTNKKEPKHQNVETNSLTKLTLKKCTKIRLIRPNLKLI